MNVRSAILAASAAALTAGWLAWAPPGADPGESGLRPGRALPDGLPATLVKPERPHDEASRPAAGESGPRNCIVESRYLDNGDGTTTEVFSCGPRQATSKHPYMAYPTEALESLAYSDPDAAAVLSLRWRYSDTAAAMSMAVRAAALAGGDATPIVAFSNAYPQPTAVDDKPLRQTVQVKYVLGTVTKLLGDPRHSVPYFEAVIREHSQDPDREIAALDQRARELVDEMRQIQLDVTGSSTFGG